MKVVPILPARANEIEIDHDVPMPKLRCKPGSFPFAKMAVGDSFAVSREMAPQLKNAVRTYINKTGRKFAIRSNPSGVRCWRIR